MTSGRISSPSLSGAPLIVPWINRALEFLWLAAAVLVPIAFVDRDYLVSEAVIAYVEVPKIALLRTIAGLMAILWLLEWAIQGGSSSRLFSALIRPSKTQALALLPELRMWLWNQPARWLVLAVWLFLGSTVLTTVLSGSFQTSLWGEIPGQDGYAAYTVASYVLLFAVVVTHLKTKPQVGRLIAALVGVGVLVTGYAVLQHYGHDFLDLTEQTGGGRLRVTSFMGNAIFSAAVMSMTIPITLMASVVTFMEPAPLRGRVGSNLKQWLLASGLTTGWGVILAVQLLGIAFTLSRGPWLGTALSLATFLGLALLFVGRSAFGRGALVLGLAAVFALAVLLWQGSTSILGVGPWAGALLALSGLAGAGVVNANWRSFNRLVLILGTALIVLAVGVLGPSELKDIGGFTGDQSQPSGAPTGDTATQLRERFSSIGTEVLSGGRSTHWRVSWILIRERPWFAFDQLSLPWLRTLIGYGPDLFRSTYLLRSPAEGADLQPLEPDHAHNYYIHQTVEQGILGLFSSVGIFLAALLASGYLLLRERIQRPALVTLLVIGLSATLAGRALEMSVGVARVSDLTTLWVVLALLASLLAWMRNPDAKGGVEPQPQPRSRNTARFPRRTQTTPTSNRPRNLQLLWRLAIVAWLVGGIGVLTWVKSVNYVRAAVAEGQAVREFHRGEFKASLTSLDRAVDLAPDVPVYHTNRAQLFLNYLVNKNVTPEQGCSLPGGPRYDVCLATESFRSNLLGAEQRPFYYRSRLASANSAGLFPLNEVAIKLYSESLSLLPNSWIIRNQLAKTYLQAEQPESALQPLRDSLEITDGTDQSAEALYLLGVAYRDLDDFENSATAMERALVWQSGASWAAEGIEILGEYYSSLGREATLNRLNGALRRNPEDSVAYYHRGQIFIQMGLFEQAYEDFNRSIELGFGWHGVFAARGRISNILGIPWATAMRDLSAAVERDPQNAEYYAYRGDVNRSGGVFSVASKDLNQALLLDPDLSLAYYFRGLFLHDMGLYQKAIEDFDHAIRLDPGLVDANNSRAESYRQLEVFAKRGLDTQAFEDLSRTFSTEFSESELFAWRGRLAQVVGPYGDAIKFLNYAIRLDPINATYYAYRGDVNRTGGLRTAANKDLEQALLLDPELSLAYYFQGLLLQDLDRYEEAVISLSQSIKLSPQLPEAYVQRSRAFRALGRDEEAAQDMETSKRLNDG